MTGKEFKKYVSDKGWSVGDALRAFEISRTTLFRQYRSAEVNKRIVAMCELQDKFRKLLDED